MNHTVYHRNGTASCHHGMTMNGGCGCDRVRAMTCGCDRTRDADGTKDTVYPYAQNTRMENDRGMGGCGCAALEGRALAMAYVPMQRLTELYEPLTALCAGTLFAELDKPFCGDTVSASAYPNAPARTCDECGCGNGMRGGGHHG